MAGAVKQTSLGVQSVTFHITDLQHRVRFITAVRRLKKTKTATQTTQEVIKLRFSGTEITLNNIQKKEKCRGKEENILIRNPLFFIQIFGSQNCKNATVLTTRLMWESADEAAAGLVTMTI